MALPNKLDLQSWLVWGMKPLMRKQKFVWRRAHSPVPERNSAGICSALAIVLFALLWGLLALSPALLLAQSRPSPTPPPEPDGVTGGGYQINSSVELGFRS